MSLTLTCYGGAEMVTGSNFMVKGSRGTILIDCGLEQGNDFAEKEMYAPFAYDAKKVDALVITHAHLDHVGRCPKLVREGFAGKLYMTAATKDLTELILKDSVGILTQEAHKRGLQPMYSESDVNTFLNLIETVEYHTEKEVAPGMSVYLRQTGHILGSCSVRVKDEDGTTLALTGDIGNSPSPYLPDWEPIPDADAILMESVYGDRVNTDKDNRVALLRDSIKRAVERGGVILMPAFSLERTQLMLYELSKLMESGELPHIPVFLDSPLAINVTAVYEKWGSTYFKPEAEDELKARHDLFQFPFLTMTPSREESDKIDETPNPKIIMAGAGMSHGGRIGRHELRYLSNPSTTLFIVGYQAPGSPGRLLQDGAPSIRIDGKEVKVKAKIETFIGWSAHADRDELVDFAAKARPQSGGKTHTYFVTLGEPSTARFFAQRIHEYIGAKAIVPVQGESFEVTKTGVTRL